MLLGINISIKSIVLTVAYGTNHRIQRVEKLVNWFLFKIDTK